MLRLTGCIFILFIFTYGCVSEKSAVAERKTRLEMARAYSADKAGDALLIWRDRELILEDYQNGFDPTKPHILTEVSTLLSGLVALAAVDDGLFTLEEPVFKTITKWRDDSQKSTITVSQLMHLTSGLEAGDHRSVPAFEEAITKPLLHLPGKRFNYGPTSYQVFCAIMDRLEQKAGPGYLKQRILEPLGIPGGRWQVVSLTQELHIPDGAELEPRCFDGAQLTARELGNIGLLLLQNGRWKGETIIGDLSPLTTSTPAGPGYGLGVWLNSDVSTSSDSLFLNNLPESIMLLRGYNHKKLIYDEAPPDLYMAAGRFNQRLYVIPSKNLVIVRLGRANLTWSDAEFLARLLNDKTL